jgi:ATP-dependent RNA helicase DDX21
MSFSTLLDDEDDIDEFEVYDDDEDALEDDVAISIDPALLVDNLGLSSRTAGALKARGIEALFPIQRMVLEPAMEGRDLVARAKTGSGKTLAFALPVIEALLAEDAAAGAAPVETEFGRGRGRRGSGRTPR